VKALRRLAIVAVVCLGMGGCGVARYAKVQVYVVDEDTQKGIPRALVRTYYIKPMLDMTYQHKAHKRSDANGFASISVATNGSQWMFLGWTHGITPVITAEAKGYPTQKAGLAMEETSSGYLKDGSGQLRRVVIRLRHGPVTELETP